MSVLVVDGLYSFTWYGSAGAGQYHINGIETDKYAFFTHVGGHERDVIVATSRSGRKYLRTTADHDTPDNLLSLPECP
nr:DUF3892 domain-containing protein [Xanthomonas campestris]